MILVDYSQCALATILSFQRELRGNEDEVKNIIRHAILSTIKSYKKKYSSKYGEMVIACDGRHYWRKEIFQYYKAGRKKAREESNLDWSLIFDTMSEIKDDLIKYFPYKVIHIDRAEGDDIIAALVKWTQTNDLVQEGIIEEPQQVLIISSDKDFKQLQTYRNVRQWSPKTKSFIEASFSEIKDYIIEHIVRGDSGDGVPSILCQDDFFVNNDKYGRAPSITKNMLSEFYEKGIDACKNELQKRNYQRNWKLVSFDNIPSDLHDEIIDAYTKYKPKGDKMSIMNYLIKNKCRLLLNELEEF